MKKKIVCIDPGIVNVGLVVCDFDEMTKRATIINASNIHPVHNIKKMSQIKQIEVISDWIMKNDQFFQRCDHIIMEKQMRIVFQVFVLLFELKYPHKMFVIGSRKATNFIDKWANKTPWNKNMKRTYNENKRYVTELYKPFFDKNPSIEHIHHVADALKMCDYYLATTCGVAQCDLLVNQ